MTRSLELLRLLFPRSVGPDLSRLNDGVEAEKSRCAYFRWLARGQPEGTELEDWFTASKEVEALLCWRERVSRRAFQFWQADGCPEGAADRHWFEAERSVARDQFRCSSSMHLALGIGIIGLLLGLGLLLESSRLEKRLAADGS